MITRFAPSPTGPLHLGHAHAALYAFDLARKNSGSFLLRIEDIDQSRARPKWEQQIFDDLEWLGLEWELPVLRQSDRLEHYSYALQTLDKKHLLYNCACNRRDILQAANAPQEGENLTYGPDGLVYPGTCRPKNGAKTIDYSAPIRLNTAAAFELTDGSINWTDNDLKTTDKKTFLKLIGDVVLSRKNMGTSYHLSVVVDDAAQGITDVTRGEDLADATAIHVLLQRVLGLPTPRYHHHKLIRDSNGKRLAKRDDAKSIATYRENGAMPDDIRRMVGLPEGP
jgi:glutamyl-Q tRNA(Asp) synthetase